MAILIPMETKFVETHNVRLIHLVRMEVTDDGQFVVLAVRRVIWIIIFEKDLEGFDKLFHCAPNDSFPKT